LVAVLVSVLPSLREHFRRKHPGRISALVKAQNSSAFRERGSFPAMVLFVTRGWEFRGARLDSRVIYRSHGYKIETPTSGESSGPMMGHWWSILQKAACGCRAATINGCGKWQRLCQRISLQSSRSETSQVSRNSSGCKFACLWLDQRVKV